MNFKNFFTHKTPRQKQISDFVKRVFSVSPSNIGYYVTAATHSSVLPKSPKSVKSNERLEFLGDAILDSVIANYLFKKHLKLTEGELTKLKAKLVSRKNLNSIAIAIQIEPVLTHSINSNSKDTSILGNALEAFIGAVFLDKGYKKTEKAVLGLLKFIDTESVLYEQKDYKSLIHEYGQQRKNEVLFRTVNELKINGRSEYEVELLVSGKVVGSAKASSKKKAQQLASKEAAMVLKL